MDLTNMPTDTMWTLTIGTFAPLIVALFNQYRWPGALKVAGTVVVCAVLAVAQCYFDGRLNWHDTPRTLLVLALTAVAAYHWVWRPSGIAPAIEVSTSAHT